MEFSKQEYWSGLPFPSPSYSSGPQQFWHQGLVLEKTIFHGWGKRGGQGVGFRMIQAHCITVPFISIIITSAPPHIIRHEILEVGDP